MSDGGAADDAKEVLRRQMREVRSAIAGDAAERERRSAAICQRVVTAIEPIVRAAGRRVHLLSYEPLAGEPDVAALAAWCADNDVATYVPAVDGDALRVTPGDVDPGQLDIAIVPGLAFTPRGERLGHGGGHFDRFLPLLDDSCLRIGVAFREQLVATLPTLGHDASVDTVITD